MGRTLAAIVNHRDSRRYLQWDVGTWSRALKFWGEHLGESLAGAECLELGCGGGGLSLWAAHRGARVVCSDLEGTDRKTEGIRRRVRGPGSIDAEDIDALSIPYHERFDIVLFKSILGGIGRNDRLDRQQAAIDQILHCLKPGGALLFAENMRGSSLHQLMRRTFVRWGRSWRYVSLDDVKGLLSGFATVTTGTCGFLAAFGLTERMRGILAWIDSHLIERLMPPRLRYVVYGVARKSCAEP